MLHHVLCPADKPGSEEPHYHLQQEERVLVKQGKLGYFIGHQTHVQSAEAEEEVVVKPGEGPLLFCHFLCSHALLGLGTKRSVSKGDQQHPYGCGILRERLWCSQVTGPGPGAKRSASRGRQHPPWGFGTALKSGGEAR